MIPPGYFDIVRRRESGGNDNAKNNLSSASGRYQFTDNTFVNTMMPLMPGKSRQEILALKNDPQMQDQAMQAFTMGNANSLKNAGIEPTAQNLYLAHHFGAGGATKLLQSNPNTPLNQIFGPEVFRANPYMNNIADAQGLISKWSGSGGGGDTNMVMGNANYVPEPVEQDNRFFRPENFGNSLINAGAAIASINSPAAAAAIAKLAQTDDSEFQTSVNQQTGQVVRVNKRTGAVQVVDAPALRQAQQAQIASDQARELDMYSKKLQLDKQYKTKPASEGFRRDVDKIEKEALGAVDLADRTANLLKAVDSGELNPDLVNRFKDSTFSLLNLSPEKRASLGLNPRQIELLSDLERFRNTAALQDQLQQAGVQTSSDFLNMMKSRFSSTDIYDPMKLKGALNATLKDFAGKAGEASDRFIGRTQVFEADPDINNADRKGRIVSVKERTGTYLKDYESYKQRWNDESTRAAQPSPQGAPVRITDEAQFKALPAGSTFIGPDGKTYRKN